MFGRALVFLIVWMATSSAVYAQGKPRTKPVRPQLPSDLQGVRIKLVRTPCFGTCPDYSVSIFGDGTVLYEGRRFVKNKGERRGRVSIDAVRTLANRFISSDFFTLQSTYGDCGSDLPTAVISIEWPGRSKTVTDCGEVPVVNIPSALIELEIAIDVTAHSQQWVGTEKDQDYR